VVVVTLGPVLVNGYRIYSRAYLQGANLEGANLAGADLGG
jgi:uncharacterized protein YjbI with pentapeptide repeats